MKRTLLWSLMLLVFLFVGAVGSVLLRADGSRLPAPDPAMLIHLPDGSTRPLAQVLELGRAGELPWPEPLTAPGAGEADPRSVEAGPDEPVVDERFSPEQLAALERVTWQDEPVFRLAELALDEGRLDEAAALYLSIPDDDPRYARAQRGLAWDVLTKGKGQPQRAVAHAHASLAADPFEGNGWQDAARAYGATLGIDVDQWD